MKKEVTRQKMQYELIDGNMSYYPYAYCKRKGAFLTKGLANTHRCECRKCEQFEKWI
ncbi:MAG: hypothetical protein MJ197_09735 [Bacteroidales bacterium]|nr:hypothetical protein [Bacteroidales bacterium]